MDVGSVYGSYYETAKSYMGLRKEEKQAGFAEKVTDKSQVSSEDMTLEEYKEYFNEKMNSLYTHPSQRNRNDIIDITDAAYKRMQTDPEYEKKISKIILYPLNIRIEFFVKRNLGALIRKAFHIDPDTRISDWIGAKSSHA